MPSMIFCDANAKRICWSIKTDTTTLEQFREHAEIYADKVTTLQSKYIALHVAIFWGIGVFAIKNGDTLKIHLDSDDMIKHLSSEQKSPDKLIEEKKSFINQLASQRSLTYQYEKITPEQNICSHLL